MLLVRIIIAFLLIVLIKLTEGNNANKGVFTITCDDQLSDDLGDDQDYFSCSGNGSGRGIGINYCINDFCSYLFDDLLENLTSDSVINIMCHVKLTSVITLVGLTNVSFTGYNNPSISCSNNGGLRFLFCHNINIKGIIWKKCDFNDGNHPVNPVIEISKTSAINIRNCSFQSLAGQAVMLTEVSGNVIIDYCMFINNINYRGHGSVIYYSSETLTSSNAKLSVSNSNFKGNRGYNSIVYFELSEGDTEYQHLTIENSGFIDNNDVVFYFVNINLYMGNILLKDNKNSRVLSAENSKIYFSGINNFTNNRQNSFLLNFSSVIFNESPMVEFDFSDGTFALYNYSSLIFKDNSTVKFTNNNNQVVYLQEHSSVILKGNSTVSFINNMATNGGAIYLIDHSRIILEGSSKVSFNYNRAVDNGGAICSHIHSTITFRENTEVLFSYNRATVGGAISLGSQSNITFKENARVAFINNVVGGDDFYHQNYADIDGGAIFIQDHSQAVFKGSSKVTLNNNKASSDGGAVFSKLYSSVIFTGNSTVIFNNNSAINAGALRGYANSIMIFDENTKVTFMHNNVPGHGGAIDLYDDSTVVFKGSSTVTFDSNTALLNGGACTCHSNVTFMDNAVINFINNKAVYNGGAIIFIGNYSVTFQKAEVTFSNNMAMNGGAILCQFSKESYINIMGVIKFHNNTALIRGNSMLINGIPTECSKHCLTEQVQVITTTFKNEQNKLKEHITTDAYEMVLQGQQYPVECTEYDDIYEYCTEYHVSDVIMLGQEISLNRKAYDYFNNPLPTENVIINSVTNNTNDLREQFDFYIVGSKINTAYNYSVKITSVYFQKEISIKLSIQLSPCYLGFQHISATRRCECYDRDNIVLCTGSSSNIKRGYWLGTVEEKLTTAICPINYCNFTCCETTDGYHSLSPGRENQCTSHRSGIACGSCEEGYTLSYAAECVSVNMCTVGWTVLAVTLTILYWIVIIIGVFAMMHYKLPIGYLYAITYYYSMVDVLLGQYSYSYLSLHITIGILSSVFKLAPQFRRDLCLVKGLSGIDIQFIQYIYPLAISIILAIISLLARCSQRLSLFIARGIIHVICFILLLSYTSMVSTSLLLLRSLQFHNVDKVYTYLSPDIEYFHGRHLAYFIVAVMFVITIIIGLPLILLLEPFLNRKINFIRIKPLLDQFQGCFKNWCRWFAAYYMICRLAQIATIVYSSDYFVTQYILIATNVIVSLVHIIVRPYNDNILNVFDGFILQLMVFVAVVPVFDTINSTVIVTATFTVVIVPLVVFLIMGFILHKATVHKLITRICNIKLKNKKVKADDNNQDERSVQEFEMIVDESMRRNATICDV